MKKQWMLIVSGLVGFGCNYEIPHGDPNSAIPASLGGCATATGNRADIVTFENLQATVFPKCVGCHSGASGAAGLNITSYASAKSFAARIEFTVRNNTMPKPPNAPLSAEEKASVKAWVLAGAPEKAATAEPPVACNEPALPNPTQPDDNTPVDPIQPIEPIVGMPADSEITFSFIKERIFSLHCLSCHSTAGGNKAGLNLETHFNTVDEIEDLEEEVGEGSMPPQSRPPLNSFERNTILRWIKLGAPK